MTKTAALRLTIGSSDCDVLGHMNSACYFAACNRAGFAMQTEIGWAPGAANKGRRYSFAVVRSEADFLAEVHEGQVLLVYVGISHIGTKSAAFENRLTLEDGTLVFQSTWRSVLMDLDTRQSVAIPDDLRAALETRMVS